MIGRSKQKNTYREKGPQAARPFREKLLKVAREFCMKAYSLKRNLQSKLIRQAILRGISSGKNRYLDKLPARGKKVRWEFWWYRGEQTFVQ